MTITHHKKKTDGRTDRLDFGSESIEMLLPYIYLGESFGFATTFIRNLPTK